LTNGKLLIAAFNIAKKWIVPLINILVYNATMWNSLRHHHVPSSTMYKMFGKVAMLNKLRESTGLAADDAYIFHHVFHPLDLEVLAHTTELIQKKPDVLKHVFRFVAFRMTPPPFGCATAWLVP